ncbi:hypothetical protein [Ornithinimicrobium kibberense]|uniref:hypothetical protein n=1 Tax=Ornithinimicrobium kibberense TaxID=282060 RepID=UPI003616D449
MGTPPVGAAPPVGGRRAARAWSSRSAAPPEGPSGPSGGGSARCPSRCWSAPSSCSSWPWSG